MRWATGNDNSDDISTSCERHGLRRTAQRRVVADAQSHGHVKGDGNEGGVQQKVREKRGDERCEVRVFQIKVVVVGAAVGNERQVRNGPNQANADQNKHQVQRVAVDDVFHAGLFGGHLLLFHPHLGLVARVNDHAKHPRRVAQNAPPEQRLVGVQGVVRHGGAVPKVNDARKLAKVLEERGRVG